MATYRIVRYYKNHHDFTLTIETGLTLAEARAHCNDPSTRGDDWFDGFEREDDDDETTFPYGADVSLID